MILVGKEFPSSVACGERDGVHWEDGTVPPLEYNSSPQFTVNLLLSCFNCA